MTLTLRYAIAALLVAASVTLISWVLVLILELLLGCAWVFRERHIGIGRIAPLLVGVLCAVSILASFGTGGTASGGLVDHGTQTTPGTQP